MFPPHSVLELLTRREIARLEQSTRDPASRAARDLSAVLEKARQSGASDEQTALAIGLVLSLADGQGKFSA